MEDAEREVQEFELRVKELTEELKNYLEEEEIKANWKGRKAELYDHLAKRIIKKLNNKSTNENR